MEKADWDDWWPRWVWVGECFFWYRLTRVVPDKFHRAVKRLCVCCLNPVTSPGRTSVDIGASANLKLVDMFCYIGDMLNVGRDADAAVETKIRIGWNKFRQMVPLLASKDISLIMRGRLYSSLVHSSMLHGNESCDPSICHMPTSKIVHFRAMEYKTLIWNPICEVKSIGHCSHTATLGSRNSYSIASDDSEALTRWLHHRYAPAKLVISRGGDILFSRVVPCYCDCCYLPALLQKVSVRCYYCADQKPAASRTVSAEEVLGTETLSPEFLGGHKSLGVDRRLSCEDEVIRPPTPPPPLPDEPPPPSVPRKEVSL